MSDSEVNVSNQVENNSEVNVSNQVENNSEENNVISNEELIQIKTYFLEAIKMDNVEIISKYYHLKLIPDVKLIIYSVIHNLNNVFNYCLTQNTELSYQVLNEDNGYSLLEYICQYGHLEMLTTLIDNNYQIDINRINTKAINQQSFIPINICIYEKHNNLIKCLLENNVDCNIAHNMTRNTPLHISILSNNHEALSMILQSGVNPNLQNQIGNTPLHLASYINDLDSVAILLQHNANINSKNFNYNTPIDYALLENNEAIINLMKEHNAETSYGKSVELVL